MGGPRTAELPRPKRDIAAGDGSAENRPRHTAGTDGARPEHGAVSRRKYGSLAPAGTAVNQPDTGERGNKACHGATTEQDGTDPEEEGDETLQRALPARGNNGVEYKARGTPEQSCTLNA